VAELTPDQGRTVASRGDHLFRRHRRSNNIFAGIHQNSGRGRRIVDLTRDYLQQLGHPTSLTQQAAVVAAAELVVLSEEARAAALEQPGAVDLDQVVRVQRLANAALHRLGLDKPPPRKSAADVTLQDIEREHASREAAE
jgi:hypothetical protein